jgi:hypothetical protein
MGTFGAGWTRAWDEPGQTEMPTVRSWSWSLVPIGPMKRLPLSLGQSWQWEERRAVGLATIGPLAEVRRMRELQLLDTCGRRCE